MFLVSTAAAATVCVRYTVACQVGRWYAQFKLPSPYPSELVVEVDKVGRDG